ncbi:hypothetical protein PIB30_030471 [Stylosanthes scabra]|uniref:3'-5' exonuclease domain-containing protein n=1 Tax=Stylosanthes scabra TaxID=79078 RepID=A0ABU6UE87_9FABA|nr:hypothetical protein [Stylosanthes scabra]
MSTSPLRHPPLKSKRWISTKLFLHRRHLHASRLVVGLGVQWTPSFKDDDPPADTLQLCVGSRCLVFHLTHANAAPRSLRDFLLDHRVTFAGFWNYLDRRKLEICRFNLGMRTEPVDLRHYARTENGFSLRQASVCRIVKECLGFDIEKRRKIGLGEWDGEYLSDEQVEYASVDPHCAFLLARDFRIWNFCSSMDEEASDGREGSTDESEDYGLANLY